MALMLAVASIVVVLSSGVTVFELRIKPDELPRYTPVWEAIPVLVGVSIPALIAPRMGSWEATSGRVRIRARAAITSAAAAVVPATIPWIAHLHLPPDARWWDISCNVAAFSAIALMSTAWVGRLAGPVIALATYAVVIITQQAAPAAAAHIPVSGAVTNLVAHPLAASVLLVLAMTSWFLTMGQSHTARRLWRNSD